MFVSIDRRSGNEILFVIVSLIIICFFFHFFSLSVFQYADGNTSMANSILHSMLLALIHVFIIKKKESVDGITPECLSEIIMIIKSTIILIYHWYFGFIICYQISSNGILAHECVLFLVQMRWNDIKLWNDAQINSINKIEGDIFICVFIVIRIPSESVYVCVYLCERLSWCFNVSLSLNDRK